MNSHGHSYVQLLKKDQIIESRWSHWIQSNNRFDMNRNSETKLHVL